MPNTAVIYFHGIGEQRRYEELSALVDALESGYREMGGVLDEVTPGVEPSRVPGRADVAFIRASHGTASESDIYRFYEAYWAPLTAEGISVLKVLNWSLRQLWNGLFQSSLSWRFRQRLHRSSLWNLLDVIFRKRPLAPRHAIILRDVHRLLDDYKEFDSVAGNARFPRGTFREFVRFLNDSYRGKKDMTLERLRKLVRRWRRYDRFLDWKTRFTCFSALACGLLLMIGSAIAFWRALANIRELLASGSGEGWEVFFQAMLAVSLLIALFACGRFLRTYVADIEFWATYEETDVKHKKRREILDLGFALLQHVLLDEQCERVVVVGHSLGSAIAYDTLLQAGRYNRARSTGRLPLEKIEAFVTMGSPLDKIHWFFECYQSRCRRYRKVVEELRGDIGTPPFTVGGKPRIYWLNLWDKADPISGSLETPGSDTYLEIRIDNFHVNFGSLNPLSCHCGYLKNARVQTFLSEVIFNCHNPYRRQNKRCYFLGPGKFPKFPNLPVYLFMASAWGAILLLSFWLFFL